MLEYLHRLISRIGYIDLGMVARRQAPLDELYTDCPSKVGLGITVRDGEATRWFASSPYAEGQKAAGEINSLLRAASDGPNDLVIPLTRRVGDALSVSRTADPTIPGAVPVIMSPLWEDGTKPDAVMLTLSDCIALLRRSIVTGPPGAGKSVLARHLAVRAAMMLGGVSTSRDATYLDYWAPKISLPVYIELRPFVEFSKWDDRGTRAVRSESIFEYLKATYLENLPDEPTGLVRRALEGGNALLVFDGLDEIRIPFQQQGLDARRHQVHHFLELCWRDLRPSRIVLTSRDYAYIDWSPPEFTRLDMGVLGEREIFDVSRKLMNFSDALGGSVAASHARVLVETMADALPEDLYERPLFASLLTGVYVRRAVKGLPELPSKPIDLYEESVALLLDRWAGRDPDGNLLERLGCSAEQLREKVEAVAYTAQENEAESDDASSSAGGTTRGFPDVIFLRELVTLPGRVNYQEIIAYLNRESGIILSPQPGTFEFAHRSFGEYLAACWLARMFPGSPTWGQLPLKLERNPQVWRETLRMMGQILVSRGREGDVWQLVDALIDPLPFAGTQIEAGSGAWCIWMAAVLVNDLLDGQPPRGRANSALAEEVVARLSDETPESPRMRLPLPARAQAWNFRSRIKSLAERHEAEPSVVWSKIPAGEFLMGLDQSDAATYAEINGPTNWKAGRETPRFGVMLPDFSIGRYAVTRANYALFLKAPDGYLADENWVPGSEEFRIEDVETVLADPWGLDLPDAPRTQVMWFDAMAYCTWIGRRLGLKIVLPTEAQWEKAARGVDGRFFPWGNVFTPARCNSQESGFGQLVAVGSYPADEYPWGPQSPRDMAGNVWEWCTTICEAAGSAKAFSYPYASDEREAIDSDVRWLRVVRGGCYLNPAHNVMTTFRGRDTPDIRMLRQGFRVATWEPTDD